MSYTSKVKEELLGKKTRNECCRRARTAALLLFSKLLEGRHTYMTSNRALAEYIADSAASQFGLMMGINTPKRSDSSRARYTVCIPDCSDSAAEELRERLLDVDEYLSCEECAGSFLRGAFLISGFSYDPEENMRAELTVSDARCANIAGTLLSVHGISCAGSSRRGANVVIIKKKDALEQFFALIGSGRAAMDVMNAAISREVKNKTTRTVNCDTANIVRTLSTSGEQNKKIKAFVDAKGIEALPADLREIALLRLENPELSLRDLGESLTTPISRSGVNHRIRRLIEYCENNI